MCSATLFAATGPDVETEHCSIVCEGDDVTLIPGHDAPCSVNGQLIAEATPLIQGAVILLGQSNMFRFNHPAQAKNLRKEYNVVSLLKKFSACLCLCSFASVLPPGRRLLFK